MKAKCIIIYTQTFFQENANMNTKIVPHVSTNSKDKLPIFDQQFLLDKNNKQQET
ncbi:MAG: hypothetical protein ACKO9I_10445 [Sphaerospermopsis kisseleviana]|nr:hypothetical protein [Sphaerospermopsis sp. LEGE 00249]